MINVLGLGARLLYTVVILPVLRGVVLNGIANFITEKLKAKDRQTLHKGD